MSLDFTTEKLKQTFQTEDSFSREALYKFYAQFESELKESTFRWRIYNLKEKKLIRPISRNEFTLIYKPAFRPLIGDSEQKIFTLIEKRFKITKKAIFSTRIINEFMLHQPARFFTLVEIEKDALESLFYYLKDNHIRNVFLQPEEKELQRYISGLDSAIVLQPLVSKAPLQKMKKISTMTLEKLLVDLFCDKKLFYTYQGSELAFIFNNAYHRYSINFTKLFGYAQRRNRKADLMEFLSNKTDIPKNHFE